MAYTSGSERNLGCLSLDSLRIFLMALICWASIIQETSELLIAELDRVGGAAQVRHASPFGHLKCLVPFKVTQEHFRWRSCDGELRRSHALLTDAFFVSEANPSSALGHHALHCCAAMPLPGETAVHPVTHVSLNERITRF